MKKESKKPIGMSMRIFTRVILTAWIGTVFCAETPAPEKTIGINPAYRDLAVKPGDDFEQYANGGWRKTAEIPPDRSSAGAAYEVFQRAEQHTAELIRGIAARNPQPGTSEEMIAADYAAFMDASKIEKRGLDPLKEKLHEIEQIGSKSDLARVLGKGLRADVDPLNATSLWTENLFGLWVTQALSEPERTVPYLLQGGLGMPDREYYVSNKPEMASLRTAYQTYVGELLKLSGMSNPSGRAERIMALEKKMAAVHADLVASQDLHKANNPITITDLKSNWPGLDWQAYLEAAGLEKQTMLIIWQPDAVKGLSALVASEPLETWKEWLAFHTINQYAGFLPHAYDDLHFGFYEKTLQGTPQQRERWKRAIAHVNADLGDAVGKIYVAKYFPPSSKAAMEELVKNLLTAFDRRIDGLTWMTPATKTQAKAKLKTLHVGVGYPERWRDYTGLMIRRDDALGNAWRAREWEYHYQLAKLGRPVDRGEWWMTPQTVNALNIPLQNSLNFPAAYLESPFFDPKADAAANYAGIGATIGHEISHSFDSSGAEINAEGKLANWWTPEDAAHFKTAGHRLVEQFNNYEPLPGLHVNGEQTLNENIADVAGLAAAYDAYKLSLHGQELPIVAGLSGDQRFFLAFAQSWRQKIRDAALRSQIITNEHAPDRERAQTVRNIDAWYDAWDVKPAEKLYLKPEERVRIW
jgi:putative endopeptidase